MKSRLAIACLLLAGCARPDAWLPPNEPAPATFRVRMETSQGPIELEVTRADAPIGADRFFNLVKHGYFDGDRFFRVVPGFVVQFGIAGDPEVTRRWQLPIKDDPAKQPNTRGTIAFATNPEPNSRTTQVFFNLADNQRLDAMGFAPFGKIVSGLDVIAKIHSGDGEKPDQDLIEALGNDYLRQHFPQLDYIVTARIE
jgi:peptidyl-prolyl cis-trans isomerase A (cyclophilin A)